MSGSGSGLAPRVRHDKHRRNASEVRRRSEMRSAFHALKSASGCPHSGRFNVLTHAEQHIRRLQQQLSDWRQTQTQQQEMDDAGAQPPPPVSATAASPSPSLPSQPSALAVCAFLPVPSCVARLSGAVLTANSTFLHLIGAASLPPAATASLSLFSLFPHSALQLQRAVAALAAEQPPSSSLPQPQSQHLLQMKEETGSAEMELLRLLRRDPPPAPAAAASPPPFQAGRLLLSEAAVVLSVTGEARQAHLAVIGCHDSGQAEPLLLLLLSPPSSTVTAAGQARATAAPTAAPAAAGWPPFPSSASHRFATHRGLGDRDALHEAGGLQTVAAPAFAPASQSSFSSYSSFAQYQRPPSPPPPPVHLSSSSSSAASMSSLLSHLVSSSFGSPHLPLFLPAQPEQPQHGELLLDPYARAGGAVPATVSGLSFSGLPASAYGLPSSSSSSPAAATAIGSSASAQYYELTEQPSPTPSLAVPLSLSLPFTQQQQQQLAQLHLQSAQQRSQRR